MTAADKAEFIEVDLIELDVTIDIEERRRRRRHAFPEAELVIVEEVGHLACYEAPDTVNGLIDDFIDRHTTRRS